MACIESRFGSMLFACNITLALSQDKTVLNCITVRWRKLSCSLADAISDIAELTYGRSLSQSTHAMTLKSRASTIYCVSVTGQSHHAGLRVRLSKTTVRVSTHVDPPN